MIFAAFRFSLHPSLIFGPMFFYVVLDHQRDNRRTAGGRLHRLGAEDFPVRKRKKFAGRLTITQRLAYSVGMKREQLQPVVIPENQPEAGIYFVPSWRVDQVQVKLDKLVRRGKKLGCTPIAYSVGESRVYCVEHSQKVSSDGNSVEFSEILKSFTQVEVSGEAPKFDGWRLVARLLHAGQTGADQTIVNAVPGETVPPQFRTSGCRCDHCQKDWVVRKDTFVVAKGDEYKQIGTSCLRDFLGHTSPDNTVAMATYYSEVIAAVFNPDAEEREEDHFGLWVRDGIVKSLPEVLAIVAAHHRVFGWFSRTVAEKMDKVPSVCTVERVIFCKAVSDDDKALVKQLTSTEDDEANAVKAIEWAKSITGESDFEHNLKSIATSGHASHRTMGLSCAIYGAWRKAVEVEASRKIAAETSIHIGTVGERIILHEIKVLSARCIGEGQFGATWLIKLTDDEGNAMTWFTNEEKLTAGSIVSIKATVKKHDEFRGVKQTLLTRVTEIATTEQAARLAALLPAAETLLASGVVNSQWQNGAVRSIEENIVPADEYEAAVGQLESEGFIVEDDNGRKVWTSDQSLANISAFAKKRLSKSAKKAAKVSKELVTA